MDLAYAYSEFFQAIHGALLSGARLQVKLLGVVKAVRHLEKRHIPDEQIWKRYTAFVQETMNLAYADEELGFILTDEQATDYLEQALSLFAAIAIVYGAQNPMDED